MKLVELLINEENEFSGIDAISIVEYPAISEDFIFFNKEETKVKLAEVDQEKRILMGAALIPERRILRHDDKLGEYYVFFSKDTVKQASELFLSKGKQNNSTLDHKYKLEGLSVVESWIVEDEVNDKSAKYNLKLPIGSWVVSVKVNNNQIWEDFVKTGSVRGFSIEGMFMQELVSEDSIEEAKATDIIKKILESLDEE
jgi:hypothetical protein